MGQTGVEKKNFFFLRTWDVTCRCELRHLKTSLNSTSSAPRRVERRRKGRAKGRVAGFRKVAEGTQWRAQGARWEGQGAGHGAPPGAGASRGPACHSQYLRPLAGLTAARAYVCACGRRLCRAERASVSSLGAHDGSGERARTRGAAALLGPAERRAQDATARLTRAGGTDGGGVRSSRAAAGLLRSPAL